MPLVFPFRPSMRFENAEGLGEYEFDYPRRRPTPGVSAVVRVLNEEAKIEHALRSILPIVDEILLVDNESEDATLEVVKEVVSRHDPEAKIRVSSYPHRVSRYGPEHGATASNSVHSLVYYNNWIAAQARFKYILKWDGDMVLVREVREEFGALLRRIQRGRWTAWTIKGQTVYRGPDGAFYLSKGEVNEQIEVFPTSYRCRFKKRDSWEAVSRPPWLRKSHFQPICFYELKFTDEDESPTGPPPNSRGRERRASGRTST